MSLDVVDYASPATRATKPLDGTVNAACACALLPMLGGLLVMALWLLTGNSSLAFAGLLVILGGLIFFLAGVGCCVTALVQNLRAGRPWRRWAPRLALAGVLLLLNFPLAHACIELATASRVRVVNSSPGTVTSFVVTDPMGSAWQLGPIAPGKSTSRWMRFDGEGAVTYTATTQLASGVVTSSGTINGYITSGSLGEHHTVTIKAGGT